MLIQFEEYVERFHTLRDVFITSGVRETISLPRQHALPHFRLLIPLFGAPNGLCSSITKSWHVKAVKKTWRRSARYKALQQMLRTISRLENMAAARQKFTENGMMVGSISEYTRYTVSQTQPGDHGSFKSEGVSFLDTDTSIATSRLSWTASKILTIPIVMPVTPTRLVIHPTRTQTQSCRIAITFMTWSLWMTLHKMNHCLR